MATKAPTRVESCTHCDGTGFRIDATSGELRYPPTDCPFCAGTGIDREASA